MTKPRTAWNARITWDSPFGLLPGGVTDRSGQLFGYKVSVTSHPYARTGGHACMWAHVTAPDGREWHLPQREVNGGWRYAFARGVEWVRDTVGFDLKQPAPWLPEST